MKGVKYILILIIAYLVFSARTCTEDEYAAAAREEKKLNIVSDSIKSVFTSDIIDNKLLKAYEMTAIEKLLDIADYLKIVTDTSLDSTFRQQALSMAAENFIPGIPVFKVWYISHPEDKFNASALSDSQLLAGGINKWAKAEQIDITCPLIRKNDSTYTGTISFHQKWISFSDLQEPAEHSGLLTLDYYLIRSMKPFGNQQLKVWDVRLGDIRKVKR